MKKHLLLITYHLSLITFCFSQNPLVKQWDYRFGGDTTEYLLSFQQTADGGYILGGISQSDIGGDKTQPIWDNCTNCITGDYWIIKIDSSGNKQWDKRFGGTGWDLLISLQQTYDGGYILGGTSYSGMNGDKTQLSRGNSDYWVVKTDWLGNKQWDKRFGGLYQDYLGSVKQTADSGYILGGFSCSGISGDKTQPTQDTAVSQQYWGDYWIVKIDANGTKLWDKDFGGASADYGAAIELTNDGGYIIGGASLSGISGDKTEPNRDSSGTTWDYWIIKTDALGNKQWDKNFGGTKDDQLTSLKQTADDGYILYGHSLSSISGDKTEPNWDSLCVFVCSHDYWIVKTDSLGAKQWDKDYGGLFDDFALGEISQTSDGGYLIPGASTSQIGGDKTGPNLGGEQAWIIKTDSAGIIQWDKTAYAFGSSDQGLAIQTNDGCYAVATVTSGMVGGDRSQPTWNDSQDYWIIKYCDTTSTTSTSIFNIQHSIFNIFPNPTTGTIQLTFNRKHNGAVMCEIMNVMGQKVFQKEIKQTDPDMHRDDVRLDVSFLAKGIYVVRVDDEVRKFVKE